MHKHRNLLVVSNGSLVGFVSVRYALAESFKGAPLIRPVHVEENVPFLVPGIGSLEHNLKKQYTDSKLI